MRNKYIQVGKIWVTEDTDPKFARFLADANDNGRRVKIEYNPGWENFSGYHGGDGLHHSLYVGRSTGSIKIPLSIPRQDSIGGEALLTCKRAVKSWRYA